MITIRKSNERGAAEHGWLSSQHTFSFADYYDPAHMGFRGLRVINEDYIKGGEGFGMHGHRDMEIMTWIVSGALTHRDSMGSEETIGPGQVQYMSAGRGVRHSEFNGSDTETVHLLQIWILPREKGAEPRYADADFRESLKSGEPVLIISPDGAHGSSPIHADAKVYAARTDSGWKRTQDLTFGGGWLQLVKGKLTLNGIELNPGDGAAIEGESSVSIEAQEKSEFLLFDLA